MSDAWGPCRVLARLRDSGLFGVVSRREKDREGCRFLGVPDMVAIYVERSGYRECRVAASELLCA
jgi:hypothetical protein